MSCGYAGYEFGATYPDSTCIDGYLWDADSCDEPGGGLTIGGEIACPRCNTKAFLRNAVTEAKDGGCGVVQFTPYCAATVWENCVQKAMIEAPEITKNFLAALPPFTTDDWPDRQAVREMRAPWDRTIERQWPWPLSDRRGGRHDDDEAHAAADKTLLLARAGETFILSNEPIWVSPLQVALSVDHAPNREWLD